MRRRIRDKIGPINGDSTPKAEKRRLQKKDYNRKYNEFEIFQEISRPVTLPARLMVPKFR